MAELYDVNQTDATNDDLTKLGWPEGMDADDVNNQARALLGALRRWYEDTEWVDLLKEQDEDFTVSRVSSTQVRITDSGATDASSKFQVGQWCRVTGTGTPTVAIGRIATIGTYSAPNVDITLDSIVDPSTWASSNVPSSTVTQVEVYFAKTIQEAAFHPVGATTGQSPKEIPTIDDLGDGATLDQGSGNGFDADQLDGQEGAYYEELASSDYLNDLVNGDMAVWQRGTTLDSTHIYPNNDAVYCADQWILLSEANDDVDVSREDSAGLIGSRYFLRQTVTSTGTTNKFGIGQILPGAVTHKYRGNAGIFSVQLKSTITDASGFRIYLLESLFPAMEDSPARDLVGTWGSEGAGVAAGTNWSIVATNQVTLTSSFQKLTVTGTFSSSALNIAVLVVCDDKTHNSADTLDIGECQLELGSTASDFKHTPFDEQMRRCQHFFAKTYDYTTDVGSSVVPGCVVGEADVLGTVHLQWPLPVTMRATPTVTAYSPNTGTSGKLYRIDASVGDVTATAGQYDSDRMASASFAGTWNHHYQAHLVATAEF